MLLAAESYLPLGGVVSDGRLAIMRAATSRAAVVRMFAPTESSSTTDGSSSGGGSSSGVSSSGVSSSVSSAVSSDGSGDGDEGADVADWSSFLVLQRYERLRDIALSIRVRRTVDEAEFALKLASEYQSDPSILQDIDFGALTLRLERDLTESSVELERADLLSDEELTSLTSRQREALEQLSAVAPALQETRSGAVAEAVPKLRRVISKARELPLTVDLPTQLVEDGFVRGALRLDPASERAALSGPATRPCLPLAHP